MTASQVGMLTLVGLAALAYYAIRAQLHPHTRCDGECGGRGMVSDDSGKHWRDCRTCGGSPKRLRFGAWIQIKMGIPVPRSKPSKKRHRMSL